MDEGDFGVGSTLIVYNGTCYNIITGAVILLHYLEILQLEKYILLVPHLCMMAIGVSCKPNNCHPENIVLLNL